MIYWLSVDELPNELVEGTEFALDLQKSLGIKYGGGDFCPVTD
jgi:hypothetical protein